MKVLTHSGEEIVSMTLKIYVMLYIANTSQKRLKTFFTLKCKWQIYSKAFCYDLLMTQK